MANTNFKEGQRIRIVKGLYKSKKFGIYVKAYGSKMCSIAIQGDSQPSRNVRLTSIAPIESTRQSTTRPDNTPVTISRDEYNTLLTDIDNMSVALKKLQLKVSAMDK